MERREAKAVLRAISVMPDPEIRELIERRRRGVSHDVVWLEGDEAREALQRGIGGEKTDASS